MEVESSEEDGTLARRIAAAAPGGARDAESELYLRYARRARLFGRRHFRDPQAADDLAQNAMMITIEKLRAGEIKDPDRIGSFILGTCRMLFRSQTRIEKRRREILDSDPPPEAIQPDEPAAFERADMDRLVDCMGRLSEQARSVVLLTFYADRTAPEIAAELRLTAGNVRVIRHRAVTDLQHCMERPQ